MNKNLRNGFLGLTALVLAGCGINDANQVILRVNSIPSEAQVYEEGNYIGNTPTTLRWNLTDKIYNQGFILTRRITLGKEGYLPKGGQIKIEIDSSKRHRSDREFKYSMLFELEGDPRYTTQNINQNSNVTQRDGGFRELNNALESIYLLKGLKGN